LIQSINLEFRFFNLRLSTVNINAYWNGTVIAARIIKLEVHFEVLFALLIILSFWCWVRIILKLLFSFSFNPHIINVIQSLNLLIENLIRMIKFLSILSINIKIILADRKIVLSKLYIIYVGWFLINIVDNYQIVNDLHLVQSITSLNAYAQIIFECDIWVQLMDKNISCLWT
jgi:hypothetical protein